MSAAHEEVLIPFGPMRGKLATELRSTLLTTSTRSLRTHGLFDAYLKQLPDEHRDAITSVVAGVWLPIELGLAHYRAVDALDLTSTQIEAMGREVGERVQGTVLGLMVRTAKTSGMTPWVALRNSPLFYERTFVGGAVSVVKLGPKEARIEVAGNPLCSVPYFRQGLRVIAVAGAELFCEKVYSHEVTKLVGATSLGFRLSWA